MIAEANAVRAGYESLLYRALVGRSVGYVASYLAAHKAEGENTLSHPSALVARWVSVRTLIVPDSDCASKTCVV